MMRLYAIEYRNGAIKVGISTAARQRVRRHDRASAVSRYIISGEVDGFSCEATLVKRMSKVALSDDDVSEMRGDWEFRGKTIGEIAEKFSVSYNRAYMIIDYRTRADVDAK